MLSDALKAELENVLTREIVAAHPIQGGDISSAFRIETEGTQAFLKIHSGDNGRAMFDAEVDGLKAIANASAVSTPNVLGIGQLDGDAYLLLEYHEPRNGTDSDWELLGRQLAELHSIALSTYGYDSDNFIGSLPQTNGKTDDWYEFFSSSRIDPMMDLASEYLTDEDRANWEALRAKLSDILIAERPCLIHGDLWNGNVIHTEDVPMLIDPAVCWAEREMDIAMSRLFGGFPDAFYNAYDEALPMTKDGLEERIKIYQLYYLLVHVVLFGKSYVGSVRGVFEMFH